MPDIILTSDRTLMTTHHNKEILGFGTSAPENFIPEWFYHLLFCPNIKHLNGVAFQAPYSLRKVEAKLIDEGFDVLTLAPKHLKNYISDAKALGIHVMDPFGWGPSSITWAKVLKTGEPYVAVHFKRLLKSPEVMSAKNNGLKIIVGGGTWQFKHKPEFLDEYGISCAVNGESEKILADIFQKAIDGEELPKFYNIGKEEIPGLEDISTIKAPTINGLTEIGRGCPRGCKFCTVTMRPLRWYPYDMIEKELKVNSEAGVTEGILHGEDVLLYGVKGVKPDREKVLKLFNLASNYYKIFGWSHISLAAAASDPKLIEQGAEIVLQNQDYVGCEIGIETCSSRLAKKTMPAKSSPFKPEDWPEMVKQTTALLHDNHVVPIYTLIVGLPEETEEDTVETIGVVEEMMHLRCVIVPLFFVPWAKLKGDGWYKFEYVTELQMELLKKCLSHDIYWIKRFSREYLKGMWYGPFMLPLYWAAIKHIEHLAKKKGVYEPVS